MSPDEMSKEQFIKHLGTLGAAGASYGASVGIEVNCKLTEVNSKFIS